MMQPLRVPYALKWPDRTCLAQYPIWTPSILVTLKNIFLLQFFNNILCVCFSFTVIFKTRISRTQMRLQKSLKIVALGRALMRTSVLH